MKYININDNLLQNSCNYILQNIDLSEIQNTYVICTSVSIASHLKTYFYQKHLYSPKIVAIGNIDPFLLIDILKSDGDNNVDVSRILGEYKNKIIHDMDKDLLIYNFFRRYTTDSNMLLDSVSATAAEITNTINLITTSNGFIKHLQDENNNFGEALNNFIDESIKKIPDDLSIRAKKDFVNTTKAAIELSNYLLQNNLETKMQKRIQITHHLCSIIKELKNVKLFFVGQNGENNLHNNLCQAASGYVNAHFLCYLTSGNFANSKQYPYINKLKQILNIQVSKNTNDNDIIKKEINFIRVENIHNQFILINKLLQNINTKSKILILASNKSDASKIFTLLNNDEFANKMSIFNSFGFEMSKTNEYFLYISLLKISVDFNIVLFLSIINNSYISNFLNLSSNDIIKLDAICREKTSQTPNAKQTLQYFVDNILAKKNAELRDKILPLCKIINSLLQHSQDIKMLMTESFNILNVIISKTTEKSQQNDVNISELKMFLLTDLKDISQDLLNNFSLDFNQNDSQISKLISLVELFVKNRSFQNNSQTLEDSNICILSMAEARYLNFDAAFIINFNDANFGFQKQNTISNSIKSLFDIKTTNDEFYESLACFKDIVFSCGQVFTLYSPQSDLISGESNPSPLLNYFGCKRYCYNQDDGIEIEVNDNSVFIPTELKIISLSNTSLSLLVEDKKEFLIKYILKTKPIDSFFAKPNAMDIGVIIHEVIANITSTDSVDNVKYITEASFIQRSQDLLRAKYLQTFLLLDYNFYFWNTMFYYVASFLYNELQNAYTANQQMDANNANCFKIIAESSQNQASNNDTKHKSTIKVNDSVFEIQATLDRIDIFNDKVIVIDYKTGTANTKGIQMDIINYILTTNNLFNGLMLEYKFYELKKMQTKNNFEVHEITSNFTQDLTTFLCKYLSNDFCFV